MSNLWTKLDEYYLNQIKTEFAKNKADHIPSGKLSASMLSKPLLWQILHTLGVPSRELDVYVQMTMLRGRQVEEAVLKRLPVIMKGQLNVEYRGVVGKIDEFIKFDGVECPIEVKSVKYSKFKRINEEADDQYILQATLYGMALKTKYVAIFIVDTQSLTPKSFLYPTSLHSRRIEGIIDAYNMAMKRKFMPKFEPTYKWQMKPEYNDYPEFMNLESDEIIELLKQKYPTAYEKWVK